MQRSKKLAITNFAMSGWKEYQYNAKKLNINIGNIKFMNIITALSVYICSWYEFSISCYKNSLNHSMTWSQKVNIISKIEKRNMLTFWMQTKKSFKYLPWFLIRIQNLHIFVRLDNLKKMLYTVVSNWKLKLPICPP